MPISSCRRRGFAASASSAKAPGALALPVIDRTRVENLALKVDGRIDAPVRPADALDEEALELARLSLVLPAVIVVPLAEGVEIDAVPDAGAGRSGSRLPACQGVWT